MHEMPRPLTAAVDAALEASMQASDGVKRVDNLVRDHMDFVWRVARRMGIPEALADDVSQQVFMVAAKRIHEIDPSSERSFLYGATVRVASETRRALLRRRDQPASDQVMDLEPDPGPGLEELVDRRRAGQLLDHVLDQMPDDCREVFVLFEFEQMTTPEIAILVGIPLGTAASRLRRAREMFQTSVRRLAAGQRGCGGEP